MFTSIPADRTSTAVEAINVNPFTKVVTLGSPMAMSTSTPTLAELRLLIL